MATLMMSDRRVSPDRRGGITSEVIDDLTRWTVTVPKGLRNRRFETFTFDMPNAIDSVNYTFTEGNAKLKKTGKKLTKLWNKPVKVIAFSIPALLACPMALTCDAFCYAMQGQFQRRSVLEPRARNLATLRHLHKVAEGWRSEGWSKGVIDFLAWKMIDNLRPYADKMNKKGGQLVVRLHDSGDLFSMWYYTMWMTVALRMPDVIFYGYTKSVKLANTYLNLRKHTPNLRLVCSVGGLEDHLIDTDKPHSKVFATQEERIAAGYVDGNDEIMGDIYAILQEVKIGLVYHGTESLDEAKQQRKVSNG
jgi:hypothetical protein